MDLSQPVVHLGPDCVYVQWTERGEISVLHRDGRLTYQFKAPVHSDVCLPLRTSHLDSVQANNRSYDIGHADGYDAGHEDGYRDGYDEGYSDARHAHEGSEVA